MDVYLVPIAADRYALYSEQVTPVGAPEAATPSLIARMRERLRTVLASSAADPNPTGSRSFLAGLRRIVARRIAEVIAEQQLLWHLRRPATARLLHPDDLTRTDALDHMRALLSRDRDRHRRWAVVDACLTIVTTPAALLPGPNVFAYYFLFRTVGHWLAQSGASRGLVGIEWQPIASPHLTSVRSALPLGSDVRHATLIAIASALGLAHASRFVDHIAPDDHQEPASRAG
jgi:hypothetical protein